MLPEMARVAAEMVHDALDAFVERDPAGAREVCERDRTLDDFYNSIFRALLTFMMENPRDITEATHLLFVARNLERIGDHATNIAEMVHFAATGERMAERAKGHNPADPA
jgi:phosphate transport system protein